MVAIAPFDSSELLNPLTPLAWLPPEAALQVQISRYIVVATFGAWSWDALSSLREEYQMFKYQIKFPDVVYLLARIFTACFILTCLVFNTVPVNDCNALITVTGWVAVFALPLNSLIFLFRIFAVFSGNHPAIVFYTFLWLSVVATIWTGPFSLETSHIGPTNYCFLYRIKPHASAGIVAAAVNDTLVFIGITWRLVMNSYVLGTCGWVRVFISGKGLGRLSKIILQGEQQYYLITVGLNVATAVVILNHSVPTSYGNLLCIPNAALLNAMATRVYRQLKLGYLKDLSSPTRGLSNTILLNFDITDTRLGARTLSASASSLASITTTTAGDLQSSFDVRSPTVSGIARAVLAGHDRGPRMGEPSVVNVVLPKADFPTLHSISMRMMPESDNSMGSREVTRGNMV